MQFIILNDTFYDTHKSKTRLSMGKISINSVAVKYHKKHL